MKSTDGFSALRFSFINYSNFMVEVGSKLLLLLVGSVALLVIVGSDCLLVLSRNLKL